jgi:hypothetical protein
LEWRFGGFWLKVGRFVAVELIEVVELMCEVVELSGDVVELSGEVVVMWWLYSVWLWLYCPALGLLRWLGFEGYPHSPTPSTLCTL